MIQPTLNDYRAVLDKIEALKNQRDQICMDNTPPWSDEVLDELEEVKYWLFKEQNLLQRMREYDREKQWHGG